MASRATHSQRASAALQKLAEEDPAFAALSFWCRHRDGDIAGAARSDDATVTYGPAFPALGLREQMGLAAHHILHIALRHARRGARLKVRLGAGFDAGLFNLAADALVNDTLAQIGFIQPRPHVTLETLDLPDLGLSRWDVERIYHALETRDAEGRRDGRESALQRAARDGFETDMDLVTNGTDADGTDGSSGPDDMEWQQHLARALEAGRIAGRGLGTLGHRLAEIAKTKTPWELVLRRLSARALQDATQIRAFRPSSRWLAQDALARDTGAPGPGFEPAIQRRVYQPRIVVALDSSGSVTARQLSLFGAQIAAIARRGGAELHLLIFDETVRSNRKLREADVSRALGAIELSRDGGTDFRPVLAQALSLDPSLIVILTDLEGPFPEKHPKVPVIWALPSPTGAQVPFGRALDLAS